MFDAALRIVLWFLGYSIARGSRFMPSLRSQITRTLTFELSAGEKVSRYWVFDGQQRRATTRKGRAPDADCSVHFQTSRQGLGALLSPRTVDKFVAGMHNGTVELRGSAFVLLWFHGLTRKFVKFGRMSPPKRHVPGAYLAHDDAACGSEKIVIEPAIARLDPAWTAAWKARASLLQVRAATDEPVLEP